MESYKITVRDDVCEGEADFSLPPALQPWVPWAGEGIALLSSDDQDPLRDVLQSYHLGCDKWAAAMGTSHQAISVAHGTAGLVLMPDQVMRCAGCEMRRDTPKGSPGTRKRWRAQLL